MGEEALGLEEFERKLTQRGAPYALVESSGGTSGYAHGPRSLGDLLSMLARRGDREFIVCAGLRYSFRQVAEQASACGAFLVRHHGAKPGERIGLTAQNGVEWIIWFFAIIAAGAVPVLTPAQSPKEIARQMEFVGCRLSIADVTARGPLTNGGFDGIVIPAECFATLSAILAGKEAVTPVFGERTGEALVAYTSGSTGAPKAISHSHLGITTGLLNMMLASALAGAAAPKRAQPAIAPRNLIVAPLSHSIGYTPMLMGVLMGSCLLLSGSDDVEAVAALMRAERATAVMGLDRSRLDRLLWRDDAAQELAAIRNWNFAGEEPPATLLDRIALVTPGAMLFSGYGLSETNGGICAVAGPGVLASVGSVGRVVPSVAVKVTNATGTTLPDGVCGQVCLRGDMLMRGYLGADGKLTGIEDGWFFTGDEGMISAARELTIFGRHDPIDWSENDASLAVLERWARCQAQVLDACAIALADAAPRRFLFVQPASGAHEAAGQVRTAIAAAGLGDVNNLLVLECQDFQRTGTGKVDRAAMCRMARAQMEAGQGQAAG